MRINKIGIYNQPNNQPNFQGELIINNKKTGQIIKQNLGKNIDNLIYNAFCDHVTNFDSMGKGVHHSECRRYEIKRFFATIADITGINDAKNLIFGKERKILEITEGHSSLSISDNENFSIHLANIDSKDFTRIMPEKKNYSFFL